MNFESAAAGVASSFINSGLNTAKITLTMMSVDPNSTWAQLSKPIDWTNEKIQTNLVTNQNVYQTFSTLTDVGQMAWGAGGLYKIAKGGVRVPDVSNNSSFIDAGTGMRINMSDIPDNFGKMNISPLSGASEVKLAGAVDDVSSLGKYDVGIYNEIKGVAGLDAHHVGQKALMKDFIPGYNPDVAPSMLVPKVGHTLRGPNGIVTRSTNGITNARQIIVRDIIS